MAGFWTRLYYKVSDESTKYFWILLITNAVAIIISVVLFAILGHVEYINDITGEPLSEESTQYYEMRRGTFFMFLLILFSSISQLYIGIHSVAASNRDHEEKCLRLVRLLHAGRPLESPNARVLDVRRSPWYQRHQVLQQPRQSARCGV